jgi:hypothetical protein
MTGTKVRNPFYSRRTPKMLHYGALLMVNPKRTRVFLDELASPQAKLSKQVFDRYVSRPPRALPFVVEIRERLYIVDGNHRLAAARQRGEQTAFVMLTRSL